jgi:hypothetical protein
VAATHARSGTSLANTGEMKSSAVQRIEYLGRAIAPLPL